MKKKMFALAFGLSLAFGSQGQWISPEELPIEGGGGCGCEGRTCTSSPGNNTGVCREVMSRGVLDYHCVTSPWYTEPNCI